MLFSVYELNIGGSEWFIIIIVIVIFIFPTKITGFSRSIGRMIGEYEKARTQISRHKDMIISDSPTKPSSRHEYTGPDIQRPISSEREKLELIAKSLSIDSENMQDDELRTLISVKLRESQQKGNNN
jgi:sec-independent protein translocase protein TatA